MATPNGVGARVPGFTRRRADDDHASDPAQLVAALVVALEEALLVARQVLGALDTAAPCRLGRADIACDGLTRPAPCASGGGLSRREAEVLGLLAGGKSNREIGAALFLSPRTVQRHVANIYLKIGTHCRAEAVAYALRHGLC